MISSIFINIHTQFIRHFFMALFLCSIFFGLVFVAQTQGLILDIPKNTSLLLHEDSNDGSALPFDLTLSKDQAPYLSFEWVDETHLDLNLHLISTEEGEADIPSGTERMREKGLKSFFRLDPHKTLSYTLVPTEEGSSERKRKNRRLGFCDSRLNGWYCDGQTLKECYFFSKRSEVRCSIGCRSSYGSASCYCGVGCQNGGTFDRFCTFCTCPSPWFGPYCSQCSLNPGFCGNGGSLNPATCSCSCPPCQNGGVLGSTCGCSCPSPWTGPHCSQCSRNPSFCRNGGLFDPSTCSCSCASSPSCVNGYWSTDGSCGCTCDPGWGGERCETCIRDSSFCLAGFELNPALCRCSCEGASCFHGGRIDPFNVDGQRCACTSCSNGWEGVRCELCGLTSASCSGFNATSCYCPPSSGAFSIKPSLLLGVLGPLLFGVLHHLKL